MNLAAVQAQLAEVQANPLPASAPAEQHADVILTLSTAATQLMSRS